MCGFEPQEHVVCVLSRRLKVRENKDDSRRTSLVYMRPIDVCMGASALGLVASRACGHTPRLGAVLHGLEPRLDQIQRLEEQRRAGAA